jgi:hypothetical protein
LYLAAVSILLGCQKENPVGQHDEQIIQIQYEYGLKDELNTFEGYVRKDLVLDGTARVPLRLSMQEQQ